MVTIFLLEVIAITAKSTKQNVFVPQLLLGKDQYWVNAAGKSSVKQGAKLCVGRDALLSLHQLCHKTSNWQKDGEDGHRGVRLQLLAALVGALQGYASPFPDVSPSVATEPFQHLHNSEYSVPVNSHCCGTATEILGTGNLEDCKSMSDLMALIDRKQWWTVLRFWLFFCSC